MTLDEQIFEQASAGTTRRRQRQRGGSAMEFALIVITLVPLMLGTGLIGANMIEAQQVQQLAHEAGRMFAQGQDFSLPGNVTILTSVGSNLGMSATSGQGGVGVVLSAITYVDAPTCASAGYTDGNGNPTSACTNYGKWVFQLRLTLGNGTYVTSSLGSPLTSGPTGVTLASDGSISLAQYVTKAGDVATFNSINPYSTAGGNITGLPSQQYLYIAEAGAPMITFNVFNAGNTYAYGIF